VAQGCEPPPGKPNAKTGPPIGLYFDFIILFVVNRLLFFIFFGAFSGDFGFYYRHPHQDSISILNLFLIFGLWAPTVATGLISSTRRGYCGLIPHTTFQAPQIEKHYEYKSVEFLSNFQNVKPSYRRLSGDGSVLGPLQLSSPLAQPLVTPLLLTKH